jgi:transposase
MSVSMLYHTYGVNGVKYKSTQFIQGMTIINAELDQFGETCPKCKSSDLHFNGIRERRLQMPPTGDKPCWLHLVMRRRACKACYCKWWPQPSFISGQRRMVRSFERHVIHLTSCMTLQDVASLLRISWNTVRDIHKEYLKRKYKKPFDLKKLCYLGIDEFSIGKGHDYMTIFVDLETAQIIHAVEGRNRKVITPFLKKLAKRGINLKAIAMDMSGPYKSAVNEFLPQLEIVFDRFHVMKLMNEVIDDIRREQHRLYKKEGNDVLNGCRYLLLRNIESLDPTKRTGLEILLEMNAPLACAHMMKEQLREFWQQPDRHASEIFLLKWIYCGGFETGIAQLVRIARTLLHHYKGLVNYYNHKITNATTEGVNNKIETLKRQAYGYRDMEYFKLRLYHLHAQKSKLIG